MNALSSRLRDKATMFVTLAVLIAGAAALPFLPAASIDSPGLLAFAGRLHPILVHFPVVLIPLVSILDVFARWKRRNELLSLVNWLWIAAVAAMTGAVLAGYLLYASGEYSGDLVREHLIGASVTGVLLGLAAAVALGFEAIPFLNQRHGYLPLLALTNLALLYTGHHGGSLTHGETYLADAWPSFSLRAIDDRPLETLNVYSDLVQPALDARCVNCHNTHKTKGDLLLSSYEPMLEGGESGKATIRPGVPQRSELLRRVSLPYDHDDAMPPEGRSPLKPVEIALIEWWIAEGASPDMSYGRGPEDSSLALDLERYIPSLRRSHARRKRERSEFRRRAAEFRATASALGLAVGVNVDSDSTLFDVSMQFPPDRLVDDNTLAELTPYFDDIATLSLAGSEITDDALYYIGRMSNLRALFLPNCAIEGEGLVYLKALPSLEVLNLSHTEATGASLLHLLSMTALETVYVYNTEASAEVIEALRAHRTDVVFHLKEGPLTTME